MHASVETIHQAIYLQARGGLRQELKRAMRQGEPPADPKAAKAADPVSANPWS